MRGGFFARVRRHANWGVVLAWAVDLRCSFPFPPRGSDDGGTDALELLSDAVDQSPDSQAPRSLRRSLLRQAGLRLAAE